LQLAFWSKRSEKPVDDGVWVLAHTGARNYKLLSASTSLTPFVYAATLFQLFILFHIIM